MERGPFGNGVDEIALATYHRFPFVVLRATKYGAVEMIWARLFPVLPFVLKLLSKESKALSLIDSLERRINYTKVGWAIVSRYVNDRISPTIFFETINKVDSML